MGGDKYDKNFMDRQISKNLRSFSDDYQLGKIFELITKPEYLVYHILITDRRKAIGTKIMLGTP